MKSKEHKQSLLEKMIASPKKAFGKAIDMYVRGVTKCGQRMGHNNVHMDGFGGYSTTFPRSYSTGTSSTRSRENDEDFAELIRVASARTMGDNRIGMDLNLKQQQQHQHQQHQHQQQQKQLRTSKGLSKSSSVVLPKIDEDKPFEQDYYPRSRSYAVGKTNTVF